MSLDANITTVILALIAVFGGSVITPFVTYYLKSKQDKAIAEAQEGRDIKAAEKVESVAKELAVNTATTAGVQAALESIKDNGSDRIDKKLDVIHTLVNSQLTEAVERFKVAVREVAALKEEMGALKAILVKIAPNDPRVKEATE